jgi:hypothetical protein
VCVQRNDRYKSYNNYQVGKDEVWLVVRWEREERGVLSLACTLGIMMIMNSIITNIIYFIFLYISNKSILLKA